MVRERGEALPPDLGSRIYQGYRAQNKTHPLWDPTGGLRLGPFGGPRGVVFSYERGTPVGFTVYIVESRVWGRGFNVWD